MSAFFEKASALIDTIAQGGAGDEATKEAVASLQEHITTDEASISELQGVVSHLLEKLAGTAPVVAEKAAAETGAAETAAQSGEAEKGAQEGDAGTAA